jgi:hypothetical protein
MSVFICQVFRTHNNHEQNTIRKTSIRFQVPTAMTMVTIFWNLTPCSSVDRYQSSQHSRGRQYVVLEC